MTKEYGQSGESTWGIYLEMSSVKRVLVGEGSAEPTVGFERVRQYFSPAPVEFFFGVRRCSEGLDILGRPGVTAVANFPGRGMADYADKLSTCNLSAYNISRAIDTGRLAPDAALVVASPPDAEGNRSLGTANGPLQSVLDAAPLIFVEEDAGLTVLPGAATIVANKAVQVIPHVRPEFAALSRPPKERDHACARHIASLIQDGMPLQIGVGGIIEALADELLTRRNLSIYTGAVGDSLRKLHVNGCLAKDRPILGSAMVGDESIMEWAASSGKVHMASSRRIHNPRWLARLSGFHSINICLSVDLAGNINSETIGNKKISGKGGSPDFAKGAYRSPGGHAIVALQARDGALVERISKPSINGHWVSYIVTENGIADLRGKAGIQRAKAIEKIF